VGKSEIFWGRLHVMGGAAGDLVSAMCHVSQLVGKRLGWISTLTQKTHNILEPVLGWLSI
jgi:hypothetical protein